MYQAEVVGMRMLMRGMRIVRTRILVMDLNLERGIEMALGASDRIVRFGLFIVLSSCQYGV
jgi:hypothetical protein